MDFSFPTIAVNSVAGVSPHAWKGEEDDQHPCDGTVLFTEGAALVCSESCEEKPWGQFIQSCCKIFLVGG